MAAKEISVKKYVVRLSALREALKVLAAEGLVLLLPNRGSRAAKLTTKDMQDLFEICQELEALAGELACERIADEHINEIGHVHAAMAQYYRDGDLTQYYRCNRQNLRSHRRCHAQSGAVSAVRIGDCPHSTRALRDSNDAAALGRCSAGT